jgi:hypothetical protein
MFDGLLILAIRLSPLGLLEQSGGIPSFLKAVEEMHADGKEHGATYKEPQELDIHLGSHDLHPCVQKTNAST